MSLVRIEGYFVTNNVTSKNTRFTKKCIRDIYAQIKKKETKLMLNHSDIVIGELVACSIDKKGLRGGFVLYPDHPLYFKIVSGIAFKIFKGLSILRYDRNTLKKGEIENINEVNLINIGLVKSPNNKECLISNISRERALDFLIEDINKLTSIKMKGG